MNHRTFSLEPFSSLKSRHPLKIAGRISRRFNSLAIRYELSMPLAELEFSPPAEIPARRSGLWEETCFELFLAMEKAPDYWEINLSPAGHWNVYRFEAYRKGMREETTITSLPFVVRARKDSLTLNLGLGLEPIIESGGPLEIGVSAVIKEGDGRVSYWALTHRGLQPDFHRRDSFLISL